MDAEITVFGRQIAVNELTAMVIWALRKRFRNVALYVMSRFHCSQDDLINEAIVLILHQSRGPRWVANPPSKPSTAIVNCVYWMLLKFQSKSIDGLTVGSDEHELLSTIAAPEYSPDINSENIFEQVKMLLTPHLAEVILKRYDNPEGRITMTAAGEKMGITRQRVEQLEKKAMEVLRASRSQICVTVECSS